MIVHRPEATEAQREAYRETAQKTSPCDSGTLQETQPLLEHEVSATFSWETGFMARFFMQRKRLHRTFGILQKNPPGRKSFIGGGIAN